MLFPSNSVTMVCRFF